VESVWKKSSKFLKKNSKQILNDKQSVDQSGNGISYYMITKAFIKNKKWKSFRYKKDREFKIQIKQN